MTDQLDISPDTHFLESIRADRGSYWALLAEGIDNAFDADASEVGLVLRKDLVGLQDNGVGITRDRESSIVRLGEHRSMPTTQLGMFGIGLKYHAVSAGDVIEVESVSSDGRMRLRADWRAVIKSGRWQIGKPEWTPALRGSTTGTLINIRLLRWPTPTPKDFKNTQDKLAQLFYPALVSGRTILLNSTALPVLREPDMTHVVQGDVRLQSGKGAHVRAGITAQPSSLYQVQVSYKHRVIMPNSTFGCGVYTGLRRMFARVDLTGAWTLSRFKNDLADNEADELQEAVEEILRPVLEECHSAQMSIQIDEMTTILNEMLPSEFVPSRPLRKKDDDEGGGKKRRTARGVTKDGEESVRGPAKKPRSNQELVIGFDKPLVDEHGYGHFEPGKPHRVILALDNSHVASLLEIRDKTIGAQSLYAIALMIYLHGRQLLPGQQLLPNFNGSFGLQVWQIASRQKPGESTETTETR